MTDTSPSGAIAPLDRARKVVMADPELQQRLSVIQNPEVFATAMIDVAASAGFELGREAVLRAIEPDPLGLDRFRPAQLTGHDLPDRQWLPIAIIPADGQLAVEWAHFGGAPLTAPFFEDQLRWARAQPFNRLFRQRTPLAGLAQARPEDGLAAPDGFIFHLSRCGSTLVSQMLGALPGTIVVSEPAPLDSVVQLVNANLGVPIEERARLLRAMVGALGRDRTGDARHYVVKLDSWHALALPLFRHAFPETPWIFLYRDPAEILVSQMRIRGMQATPGTMPQDLYGIVGGEDMPAEEYCARAFACICAAVLDHAELGGCLLVNYASLPGAAEDEILSYFGIDADAAGLAAMKVAAGRDAKAPAMPFIADTDAKQKEASDAIRAAVEAHLAEPYRRLEAMRLAPGK
ncbi:hypothetical protein GCM10009087_43090 [Sphingomonas oligophenolica]|uniref:Aspartyl beta-hydroxylase n=1 Tax=Sphingomonas oligophenolica TaxID=301154 RepID=A0ABU9XZH9_9SPHN